MVVSLLLCALLLAFCHAQQKYYFGDCAYSGVNNIDNTGACLTRASTPIYLKFERVNTASFLRPVGIDQYTLDNDQRLLTSVYYADGKPYNFQTIKYDGTSEQFSTISGLTEEVKITTVRNNVPRTRFQSGWAFTGTGRSGEVACIFPNGTNILWVALGNYGLMRGSLVADKFANSGWDGALMVATTAGYMFQIYEKSASPQFRPIVQNANGSPRSFTSWCEGLDIFPVTAAWGSYGGCLIVGNEQIAQAFVACPPAAASPNTFPALVSHYTPLRIEDVDHIEPDENFYGVNYGAGRLVGVAASQWKTVTSSLLMTSEFGGVSGWHTGQMLLTLDQASGLFQWTRIWYATDSPLKDITHYEHVTFARAGILNIPPGAPLCFVILEITGGTRSAGAYAIPTPITSWYSYNSATRSSATLLSLTTSSRLYTFFTVDANNFISFVIAANPSQAGIIRVSVTGINVDFRGSVLTIQDDPDDKFSWDVSTGLGSFVWNMTAGQSDGVALSPVVILGTGKGTCFRLSVDTPQGSHKLTSWWSFWGNAVQKNETQIPSFTEKPKFCVYECSNTCFLFTNCGTCTAAAGCGWCDSLSTCLKTTDPAYTFCPVKYSGNGTCPCDLAVGCETCQAFSGCTWCCSPAGQQCARIGDPNVVCNATYSSIAQCSTAGGCSGSCGPGTCSCGVCVCPPDFSGPNCEFENGCDGVPNSGLVFDRCGICGGNGTTCLGCDGTVFGPKYDQCGICGGNGTTCFDLCPYDTCFLCTLDPENCHWCAPKGNAQDAKGTCAPKSEGCAAGFSEVKECGAVTTIVLSGGAIAGIIIAALILAAIVLLCLIFGGGGGVAVGLFAAQRGKMSSVQNNPLFVDKAPANNPFYEN